VGLRRTARWLRGGKETLWLRCELSKEGPIPKNEILEAATCHHLAFCAGMRVRERAGVRGRAIVLWWLFSPPCFNLTLNCFRRRKIEQRKGFSGGNYEFLSVKSEKMSVNYEEISVE